MNDKLTMPWDRLLWGVLFYSGDDPPILIGYRCISEPCHAAGHEGEPTRALLFNTRRQARIWCDETNQKWLERRDGSLELWRVRPVRVREIIAPI